MTTKEIYKLAEEIHNEINKRKKEDSDWWEKHNKWKAKHLPELVEWKYVKYKITQKVSFSGNQIIAILESKQEYEK